MPVARAPRPVVIHGGSSGHLWKDGAATLLWWDVDNPNNLPAVDDAVRKMVKNRRQYTLAVPYLASAAHSVDDIEVIIMKHIRKRGERACGH